MRNVSALRPDDAEPWTSSLDSKVNIRIYNSHTPLLLTHTASPGHALPMSVQVFVGLSGDRLSLDPQNVNTLEALRTFIHQQASIQPRNQVLLTSQGKQVRTQTLLTETELFVFDSSRLNNKASPASSTSSSQDADFNPDTPPDTISNQNDLQAWQSLFRVRRSWASGLLNGCESKARQAEKYQDEQTVIERSLGVAVASLQQHIANAEQKFSGVEGWSEEVLQEQDAHLGNWEANYNKLKDIPARAEFTRFIQPATSSSRRSSQQGSITNLQAFIDGQNVKKAASGAQSLMKTFAQKVLGMQQELHKASNDTNELLQAVDALGNKSWTSNASEPTQLLDEIEMVVKKMASDLEHVQQLPRSSQSVSQASKMALLHTRNYLPNLSQYCTEMNELVQRNRQKRNDSAESALDHMRTLSSVETILSQLHQDMKAVEVPQDDQRVFPALTAVSRLPSVYGSLMVECVRRKEWVTKMRKDAGTLQEEVATYQDEEDKRRKKWVRTVEDVVKPEALQSSVLGIELSLQNEGNSWPTVTREELQEYLKGLYNVYGDSTVTREMEQAIKDLDKPTRKQVKHAKAFKNGSMHEAAFGDTSLMLRGDEQNKAMRDVNARLEEELRGQKSRVRKLEDLLHRQTQIGRASSGDMFNPQGFSRTASNQVSQDDASRNNSISKQRRPSIQAIEERRLAKRVVDLEAELQAAREEASSRKNSDVEAQKQIEEATLTKKDLMENMEAQQREFATERRHLEQELTEAKERVEELENELERLMGSRDDERTGADARITAFEEEIARLKEDAMGHAARAATEADARQSVEHRLAEAERARAEAEGELRKMRLEREERQEADAENIQILATAHSHLSPEAETPSGILSLASALEELSRRSVAHAKDLEEAVAFAKSENGSLWSSNEKQKAELADAAQSKAEAEDELQKVRNALSAEEAKATSLEHQLNEEQEQLRMLRTKFADGETGSEVLRQRVTEEEARAGKLFSELAEARSHINSLDVELMRRDQKHKAYHASADASAKRLQKRAERAKEISQRLFAQNSRLSRLLERLGLAISYQDDAMVVERASKMGSSTTMIDPQSHMNRTVSMTSPPPTRKSSGTDETSDVSTVAWPDAQSAEDEATQYEAFLAHLSRFNIDTFSDAIVKRVRDFEYTARKYNKEAKESVKRADAYKERSVKLRTEAHSKIAVKDFKEGDLALFLPTRGQAKGAWAAFNVGCPHYFLAERDGMRLGSRDFIVARISKIEQRVVDLSKSIPDSAATGELAENGSVTGADNNYINDDNPFDLSDGLTWWMVHASEERGAGLGLGAPSTPGLGKSTVAAANVDAKGSIRVQRKGIGKEGEASKHLNKSLDSRRSSSTSKKSLVGVLAGQSPTVAVGGNAESGGQGNARQSLEGARPLPAPTGASGLGIAADGNPAAVANGAIDGNEPGTGVPAPQQPPQNEQVRKDLLWGP